MHASDTCTSPPSTHSIFKSVDLTHVQYDSADPLGPIIAYTTLIPIALLVSYTTQCVLSRDLASGFMFLGQLVNEAINLVLKVSIKQARPTDHLGDGYGMPSSHAQFIWFFAVYASLYTTYRLNFRYTIWKPIIVSGLITSATIVAYSRVRLQYHSIEQVAVGSALGVCVGFFWYIVVQYMLFPLADRLGIVEGWMGRLFLLRDTRKTGSLLVVQREWMGLFNHGAPAISKPKSE